MKQYGALFTFNNFVHHTPIIFVSMVVYFSSLLESFVQNSSDASMVPYIDFLDSSYMHFLLQLSR